MHTSGWFQEFFEIIRYDVKQIKIMYASFLFRIHFFVFFAKLKIVTINLELVKWYHLHFEQRANLIGLILIKGRGKRIS